MLILLVFLLPLMSFIINLSSALYSYNNSNKQQSINFINWLISILFLLILTVISFILFIQTSKSPDVINFYLGNWFVSGNFFIDIIFSFDVFSAVFVLLISFVSFLVQFYSYFYMPKEDNLSRFLAYLNLFILTMIILITSKNLLQAFIGWEGVSFTSYLLISYYFKENLAKKASFKALIINRFSDIAFIFAIILTFNIFGTLDFFEISTNLNKIKDINFVLFDINLSAVNLLGILFLIAAFTKSAQIILHIWLPDAMEAPTPVSALLHAATMVTAGIFLIIKLSPLFLLSDFLNNFIIIISLITIIYSALQASIESDIKKIIAYSTISQLGYMFLSVGVGYYIGAIFHLFTHAFFKALLFLCAGSVIHSTHNQNIKTMPQNLYKQMPITYVSSLIGVFSLIGIFGFSGYYSKEMILSNIVLMPSVSMNLIILIFALLGVVLTSFYSIRMIIYTFHSNNNATYTTKESSVGILIILILLSILAIFGGKILFNDFVGNYSTLFWKQSVIILENYNEELLNHNIVWYSLIAIFIGFMVNYIFYIRDNIFTAKVKVFFPLLYNLLINRLYLDYIYNLLAKLFNNISLFLGKTDINKIDKYLPNNTGLLIYKMSKLFYKSQNNSLAIYAFIMVGGALIILTYSIFYLKGF